jgi:hypothetical protein
MPRGMIEILWTGSCLPIEDRNATNASKHYGVTVKDPICTHLCGERRDAATAARTAEAAMSPGSLAVLPTIGVGAQPEEARTTLGGAGDGPRDRREAGIRSVAPQIAARNNGDRVPLALIFAHQHGAGLEPPWPARIVARDVIPDVIARTASEAFPVSAKTLPCTKVPTAFPLSSAKAKSSSTCACAAV